MTATSVWTYLIPVYVLGGVLLLVLALALLGRVQNGRYVRPIARGLARVPLLRRLMVRASRAAMERDNPELASAMQKLERVGGLNDPRRAQAALGRLMPAERRAWLEVAEREGAVPEPANRAERRRRERMRSQRGR